MPLWSNWGLIVVGLAIIGFMVWRRISAVRLKAHRKTFYPTESATVARPPAPVPNERLETLVARLYGNRHQAERLIEFERLRAPEARIDQLAENAIDQLERDRNR
jgi:hypothetical protein